MSLPCPVVSVLILADGNTSTMTANASNQFNARFSGGYRFMANGSTQWMAIANTGYVTINNIPTAASATDILVSNGGVVSTRTLASLGIPVITPAALTKTDDTNVTISLGGTPATSLLQGVSLTMGWTGVLAISRGGTGLGSLGTANQVLRVNTGATALEYFTPDWTSNTGTVTSVGLSASGALNVSGSPITTSGTIALNWTGTSSQYVRGDGSLATFPSIPSITPSALTKTDDTNVTLTLGGTPGTALLQNVSLTLGWTGVLAISRGGTGLGTLGTANQVLRVNAGGTALEYATLTDLDAQTLTWTKATSNLAISNGNSVNLFNLTSLTSGDLIKWDGTDWVNFTPTWTTNTGTVTSVAASISGTAIVITGSPITTYGTLDFTWMGSIYQYVRGDGSLATFPSIPSITPSALTKTDDTNVTISLGGTPATALLQGVSLTMGWNGVLAISRGGTGLGSLGTANQLLRVNTGETALEYFTPTWTTNTGTVTSVGLSASGALSVTGSPVTGSGVMTLDWTGTTSQYVRGDGSLNTFPTIPVVQWSDSLVAYGRTSVGGLTYPCLSCLLFVFST